MKKAESQNATITAVTVKPGYIYLGLTHFARQTSSRSRAHNFSCVSSVLQLVCHRQSVSNPLYKSLLGHISTRRGARSFSINLHPRTELNLSPITLPPNPSPKPQTYHDGLMCGCLPTAPRQGHLEWPGLAALVPAQNDVPVVPVEDLAGDLRATHAALPPLGALGDEKADGVGDGGPRVNPQVVEVVVAQVHGRLVRAAHAAAVAGPGGACAAGP